MDVSHLGEFELIARLTQMLPKYNNVALGIGDDCTVLDFDGELSLLATCDCQVEGVHFTLQTSTPEQVGRKALAVNLSDIASMGGVPRFALVSLILPAHLPVAVLDGIYAGLRQEADPFAVSIVGGNIAGAGKGNQLIIDITLLGTVKQGQALTRSGARAGDLICVTGSLGDSSAGLYTLLHPTIRYPEAALTYVRERHRTPQPRVRESAVPGRLGPAIVTAMLDISDGLSGDLAHLCERSHVGAVIEVSQIPLSPALQEIATAAEQDPYHWALHGGEDYELLFTVSPEHVQQVQDMVYSETGTQVTVIGTIQPAADGMKLVGSDGKITSLIAHSWDHLHTS